MWTYCIVRNLVVVCMGCVIAGCRMCSSAHKSQVAKLKGWQAYRDRQELIDPSKQCSRPASTAGFLPAAHLIPPDQNKPRPSRRSLVTSPVSHWLLPNCFRKIDGDFIGFEINATVTVKSTAFWDVTSYSPVEGYRRFRRTCSLHIQGLRCQQDAGSKLSSLFVEDMFILMNFLIWKERWDTYYGVSEKNNETFKGSEPEIRSWYYCTSIADTALISAQNPKKLLRACCWPSWFHFTCTCNWVRRKGY